MVIVISDLATARRGGMSGNGGNGQIVCENRFEFNKCKNNCYADRDCSDEPNLNCSVKCKQSCFRLEKIGRCRGALLANIIRKRGRIGAGSRRGGGGNGGQFNGNARSNNGGGGGGGGGNGGGGGGGLSGLFG